jgi:hypothetical protein
MPFEKCRYCESLYHFRPHDIWQWIQINREPFNKGETVWGVCTECYKKGLRNDQHLPPETSPPDEDT